MLAARPLTALHSFFKLFMVAELNRQQRLIKKGSTSPPGMIRA
jgi:hypothetical protein